MEIHCAVETIARAHRLIVPRRSLLVAIGGFDGSGKGYIAGKLAACCAGAIYASPTSTSTAG